MYECSDSVFNNCIFSRSEQIKNHYYMFSNISNFQSKYLYGNRNKSGLRICHWNKSNAAMTSRLSEIRNIISVHRPHLLGISEANIYCNQDKNIFNISGF